MPIDDQQILCAMARGAFTDLDDDSLVGRRREGHRCLVGHVHRRYANGWRRQNEPIHECRNQLADPGCGQRVGICGQVCGVLLNRTAGEKNEGVPLQLRLDLRLGQFGENASRQVHVWFVLAAAMTSESFTAAPFRSMEASAA